MAAVFSLFLVLAFSILITRVASVALSLTGLSREAARFQARSAFTGVGFTTDESEKVVNHPVRRRVLLTLMLLGNAGVVTAISSLILTFVDIKRGGTTVLYLIIIVGGVSLLWALSASKWLDRRLSKLIHWALGRYTTLEVKDYASLMHLARGYRINELHVKEEDWLANQTLAESRLRDEGVMALGVTRTDGTYIGAPTGTTRILPGDTLILYGRAGRLETLDERKRDWRGEEQHAKAVAEQEEVTREEAQEDPAGAAGHANSRSTAKAAQKRREAEQRLSQTRRSEDEAGQAQAEEEAQAEEQVQQDARSRATS